MKHERLLWNILELMITSPFSRLWSKKKTIPNVICIFKRKNRRWEKILYRGQNETNLSEKKKTRFLTWNCNACVSWLRMSHYTSFENRVTSYPFLSTINRKYGLEILDFRRILGENCLVNLQSKCRNCVHGSIEQAHRKISILGYAKYYPGANLLLSSPFSVVYGLWEQMTRALKVYSNVISGPIAEKMSEMFPGKIIIGS